MSRSNVKTAVLLKFYWTRRDISAANFSDKSKNYLIKNILTSNFKNVNKLYTKTIKITILCKKKKRTTDANNLAITCFISLN